jgi:hypothetical protein
MSVNFGRAADPGYFVMGIALPLNRPVGPNRDEDDALPCYVVNALPGKPDRFSRNAIVSVHTFAKTTAEAKAADHAARWIDGQGRDRRECTARVDRLPRPEHRARARNVSRADPLHLRQPATPRVLLPARQSR